MWGAIASFLANKIFSGGGGSGQSAEENAMNDIKSKTAQYMGPTETPRLGGLSEAGNQRGEIFQKSPRVTQALMGIYKNMQRDRGGM